MGGDELIGLIVIRRQGGVAVPVATLWCGHTPVCDVCGVVSESLLHESAILSAALRRRGPPLRLARVGPKLAPVLAFVVDGRRAQRQRDAGTGGRYHRRYCAVGHVFCNTQCSVTCSVTTQALAFSGENRPAIGQPQAHSRCAGRAAHTRCAARAADTPPGPGSV